MTTPPQGRDALMAELLAIHAERRRIMSGEPSGTPTAGGVEALKQALDHMRAMVGEIDADGKQLYVSESVTAVLGYQPEELIGRPTHELIHEGDLGHMLEMLRELEKGERSVESEIRTRHKSGHYVWLHVTCTRFLGPNDEPRVVCFGRDVSDIKAANAALQDSEERFVALTRQAADLIMELDENGRFLFVSENTEQVLGRNVGDLMGHNMAEFVAEGKIHPDDAREMMRGFVETMRIGRRTGTRMARLAHADGTWHWFESRFTTYRVRDGGLRAVVIARDATERVQAEEELRESEERYRLITETAHEVIAEADAEGRLSFVSPAIKEVLGHEPSELEGTTPVQLVHPEDVEDAVARYLGGIESGEPQRSTAFRARHRDGSWRWLEGEGYAFRGAGGAVRFLMVARDITERRAAEAHRRELEERMQQAQRLEGLGVMAGGIAHDFNNLLTPVLGEASLVLMDLPEDSPARARIKKIQKAARRASTLTHQMLAYAGKGPLTIEPVDLSALVGDMAQLLESSLVRRSQLTLELDTQIPLVKGDASQLSQVVMNLITNAGEAVPESGGRIAIRTGRFEALGEGSTRWLGGPLPRGTAVYVEVSDDGIGMDADTRDRIFDPFFTTKFMGRGLGLAATLGIVRAHRGAIEIDSEPGEGTRFRVMFPAVEGVVTGARIDTAGAESWRSEGSVLVVDDDQGVRDLARATLERAGLRVHTAAGTEDGWRLFQKHADELDLVVLDQTMPIEAGVDLYAAVRRERPEISVLVISGYSKEVGGRPGGDARSFLQKPFSSEDLLERVRAVFSS